MYKKIDTSQVPKRERKSESLFEKTREWSKMKSDMDKGLKPKEALRVTLSEEEKVEYGITNRRTIARFLQKYIAEKGFDYTVKSFQRDGLDFIVVTGAK